MGKPLSSYRTPLTFASPEVGSGEFRVLPDGHLMALAGTGESRPPSTRPTLVPPLDLREAETGTMRAPGLPLDLLVPVDTGLRPTSLDHRAAVLLLQVDGHSTLAEIANAVGLPRAEVYAGFVALLRRGVVTLDTVASSTRREGR